LGRDTLRPMSMPIGVIGAGNMGSAMVRGWLRLGSGSPAILVFDKVPGAVDKLVGSSAVCVASSLTQLVSETDLIFVVVKPQDASGVLGRLGSLLGQEQTVVSCMAGLSLSWLRAQLGNGPRLIRIMPNLGVELGVGAIAVALEPGMGEAEVEGCLSAIAQIGSAEIVSEELMDVATAISGTGPGILALALEAMEDGAVRAGMPRVVGRRLLRETVLGAARLLTERGQSLQSFSLELASQDPFGAPGIRILEDREIRRAFQSAVEAAVQQSRLLSR